jgi:hypothetical protein
LTCFFTGDPLNSGLADSGIGSKEGEEADDERKKRHYVFTV